MEYFDFNSFYTCQEGAAHFLNHKTLRHLYVPESIEKQG